MSALAETRRQTEPVTQYGAVETNGVGNGKGWGEGPGRLEAGAERPRLHHLNGTGGRERRSKAGAPPLVCTLWLEEQIRREETSRPSYPHLYREWLERYHLLRGYYPADPKRSFRAAVKSCHNRLGR